jgi:hypothetical protein
MSPSTHLLMSWAVADSFALTPRDRKLVTWCGLLPDLDGLGLGVDLANALAGRPDTAYYHIYHHDLLHGLPAALAVPLLLCLIGRQRWKVFLLGVLVFHLHLLCDLAGSRGPAPTDLWPIPYLSPFSHHLTFLWKGQWRLDGWQNFTVSLALLALVLARAVRRGYSPVSLFSERADRAVVAVLQKWWH